MYDEIMLYHSDEAAFKYIQEKDTNPRGVLHPKYGHRLRKAFKEQCLISASNNNKFKNKELK